MSASLNRHAFLSRCTHRRAVTPGCPSSLRAFGGSFWYPLIPRLEESTDTFFLYVCFLNLDSTAESFSSINVSMPSFIIALCMDLQGKLLSHSSGRSYMLPSRWLSISLYSFLCHQEKNEEHGLKAVFKVPCSCVLVRVPWNP